MSDNNTTGFDPATIQELRDFEAEIQEKAQALTSIELFEACLRAKMANFGHWKIIITKVNNQLVITEPNGHNALFHLDEYANIGKATGCYILGEVKDGCPSVRIYQ